MLPNSLEEELAVDAITLKSLYFRLSPQDLHQVAFQLTERNKLKHSFNCEKKIAGKNRLKRFLSRHPNLTKRKPEA